MKKKILSLLLIISLLSTLGAAAYADSIVGGTVTFDGNTLTTNFTSETFSGAAGSLQPGDEGEITISLVNNHSKPVQWWLKNEILENFLASEAGGAYTYKLSFIPPSGTEKVIYESKRVGGDDAAQNSQNGLKQINSALKDYVFLGSANANQTGVLKLFIKLDGETQGNAYINKLAKLQLKFAAETDRVVMTGDETNSMPFLAASAISGVVLLSLAFLSLNQQKKKQKGEAK